jgi:type I restriction enzyme M protein
VLTNPPFGHRQAARVFTGDGEAETEREDYERANFAVTTGNKQLSFLQYVMTILAPNGTAAVVVPDNVPFEGGAGKRIRRQLLEEIRLPHAVEPAD